ncbi:MAG: cytochrome c3 family protein [Bryobacterales bacterium]|nr:cytochrome c3 family protein [Bryobacterales bacterium]
MMALFALLASAGPPPCAACHPAEAKAHALTLMSQTLERVESARILTRWPDLTFQLGRYRYRIRRNGGQSEYSVSDGAATLTAAIRWAMGQGDAGQTYILDHQGSPLESRVSFYNDIQGLGVTIGAPAGLPKDLAEALGRPMTAQDMKECFGCHSAPAAQPDLSVAKYSFAWADTLQPGVQCENCHAGSDAHAAARQAGDVKTARLQRYKAATTEEISDVCGKCHRTWAEISVHGPKTIANVRFQPYRIALSRCYDAVDRRISCTACHNPHNRHGGSAAAISDRVCQTCHEPSTADTRASARLCKTGQSGCAGCHMPKYEIPGSHHEFTDHFIRIAKPGEPYPI